MGPPLATLAFLAVLALVGVVLADCAEKAWRFYQVQALRRKLEEVDKALSRLIAELGERRP